MDRWLTWRDVRWDGREVVIGPVGRLWHRWKHIEFCCQAHATEAACSLRIYVEVCRVDRSMAGVENMLKLMAPGVIRSK